MEMTLMCY